MANIKVNDLFNLNLTGADLFNDSESFLTELSDESEQIGVIGGGCLPTSCIPTSCEEVSCVQCSRYDAVVEVY